MAGMASGRDTPTSYLNTFLIAGLVLAVIGGIIASAAWPGTEVGMSLEVEETGSRVVALLGLALAWVGNALMMVGIIGYGVKFGREASPEKLSLTRDGKPVS